MQLRADGVQSLVKDQGAQHPIQVAIEHGGASVSLAEDLAPARTGTYYFFWMSCTPFTETPLVVGSSKTRRIRALKRNTNLDKALKAGEAKLTASKPYLEVS
jgi:hypothetical protein